MPNRPSCPICRDNAFVRVEKVVSGRRVYEEFYCGRCNHRWQVENNLPPRIADRRQAERKPR